MTQFFLPKALLLKEWKEHRWWMLAGIILLLAHPILDVVHVIGGTPSVAGRKLDVFWQVLVPTIYGTNIVPNTIGYPTSYYLFGVPYVSTLSGLVAMSLIIALVTVERSRGTMWFTLSGPVRRSTLLRVKVMLSLLIVLSTLAIKFLVLLSCDAVTGNMAPVRMVFDWLFVNALFELSMMAVGLACATVIMVGFAAGLWAVFIAVVPTALGRAVLPSGALSNPANHIGGQPVLAGHIANFLRALSPWDYVSPTMSMSFGEGSFPLTSLAIGQSGHSVGLTAIWFVFWILGWGYLAWRAYLRAPLENNTQFFLFPQLWPFALWFVTGLVSYLGVSAALTNHGILEQEPYAILVRFLAVWVLLGLAGTVGLRMWVRR